jgi:hypothetical protein
MSRRKYDPKDLEEMSNKDLQKELKKLKLPTSGNKDVLVSRLLTFNMTVKELRQALKREGLKVSGRKQELVQRLLTEGKKVSKSAGRRTKTKKVKVPKRRAKSPVRCTVGKNNREYYFDPDTGKRVKDIEATKRGKETCARFERVPVSPRDRRRRTTVPRKVRGKTAVPTSRRVSLPTLKKVRDFTALKKVNSDLIKLEKSASESKTYGTLLKELDRVIADLRKASKDVSPEAKMALVGLETNMKELKDVLEGQPKRRRIEDNVRRILKDISTEASDSFVDAASTMDDDTLKSEDLTEALSTTVLDEKVQQNIRKSMTKNILTKSDERDLEELMKNIRRSIRKSESAAKRRPTASEERELKKLAQSMERSKEATEFKALETLLKDDVLVDVDLYLVTYDAASRLWLYLGTLDKRTAIAAQYLKENVVRSHDDWIYKLYRDEDRDPLTDGIYLAAIPEGEGVEQVLKPEDLSNLFRVLVPDIKPSAPSLEGLVEEGVLDILRTAVRGTSQYAVVEASYDWDQNQYLYDATRKESLSLRDAEEARMLYRSTNVSPYFNRYYVALDKNDAPLGVLPYRSSEQQVYYDVNRFEEPRVSGFSDSSSTTQVETVLSDTSYEILV